MKKQILNIVALLTIFSLALAACGTQPTAAPAPAESVVSSNEVVAEGRLGGLLSAVRGMWNVDQAPVLVIDEAAGTVELNIALLNQQFRVGGPGGGR